MEQSPIAVRIWPYLQERFPLGKHGPLIAAFAFAAISLSREARGAAGFVSASQFLAAFGFCFIFFLHLRIADEHKDAEEDLAVRPHLPVPRGLVTLHELRIFGLFMGVFQVAILAYYPAIIGLALMAYAYQWLMYHEFFAPAFLKRSLPLYTLSHMAILPLADVVSSGFDWAVAAQAFPLPFLWIFGLSYSNGLVLEIGRKIRHSSQEEAGYATYSSLFGGQRATLLWAGCMALNLLFVGIICAQFYSASFLIVMLGIGLLSCFPALLFYLAPSPVRSKALEAASGIWALGMYVALGVAHYI